jgi:carbamoyl-phosphate synthase small subunit
MRWTWADGRGSRCGMCGDDDDDAGCKVTVVPCKTPAAEVLAMKPDGVFFSNGPGDPSAAPYAVENAKAILGKMPVFGICMGHQVLGQAFGGKTYKLKFG